MLWCIGMVATAQTFSPERTGGVYYAYPVTASQRMAMPDGYEP